MLPVGNHLVENGVFIYSRHSANWLTLGGLSSGTYPALIRQNSMAHKLLIIEEEQDVLDNLSTHLNDAGFEVGHASDGIDGFTQAISHTWDLIILDTKLPGLGGLEVCRQVSNRNPEIPIFLVSTETTDADRLEGFSAGADDFICMPFCTTGVVARIKALFRRLDIEHGRAGSDSVEAANIIIDKRMHTVSVSGDYIDLTPREFSLLACFVESPGKVFTRRELLDTVWGYDHSCYLHIVNTHINRLRKKLKQHHASENYIETVWGVGYKFVYSKSAGPANPNVLKQSSSTT